MNMILFVLHDNARLDEILSAWEEEGVSGITILPSTGVGRIRNSPLRDDLPLIPRLEDLLSHTEILNRTIFTLTDNDDLIDRVIAATQNVLGDLNNPNTGILAIIPVDRVFGLHRKTKPGH